jgi:hypothetical protein
MKKENNEEKEIYSCSVVLSIQNIINICGTIEEIKEKLQFINDNLFYVEKPDGFFDEDFIFPEPCILVKEEDVSSIRVFKLGEFEKECY